MQKKIIIIVAGLGIGLTVGFFSVRSWWATTQQELRAMGIRAQREAVAYGKSHKENECVNKALSNIQLCPGIACRAEVGVFLEHCPKVAQYCEKPRGKKKKAP